jgi:hypothetical protein
VSGLSNLLYVIIGTRRSSEESFSDFSFFGARKCPKKNHEISPVWLFIAEKGAWGQYWPIEYGEMRGLAP